MPNVTAKIAQAVVGCLIARTITPAILETFAKQWPLFLAVVVSTLLVSAVVGWLIARSAIMPGTTAIWGLLPGGASASVLMADEFGADARLVAFMQYTRVLFVAVIASVIARLWVEAPSSPVASAVWFPPLHGLALAETLGLIALGVLAGGASRIPNGTMLLPMAAGALLHGFEMVTIDLPPWLLAASYLCLGWNIGLRFTRKVLASAGRALPHTIASILFLIGFCGGLAFLLVKVLGVDPLTAYLATSPGGADSVAIIAASSHVDSSFVMALQTVRLLIVVLLGPMISRAVAGLVPARVAAP
jgi:membrane AbrB-like protein